QLQLQRRGIHAIHAYNDVQQGIQIMTSEMKKGNLFVCEECVNTIREIESYCWDSKAAERGYDEPLKKADHSTDCLRYALATHKIASTNTYKHDSDKYLQNRF